MGALAGTLRTAWQGRKNTHMTLCLRTDSWWDAGQKRRVELGARPDPRDDPLHELWSPQFLEMLNDHTFPPAVEGDIWIIRGGWRIDEDPPAFYMSYNEQRRHWPIIGFGLTCPNTQCDSGVHLWTHATDCAAFQGLPCKNGGRHSCWTWSGEIANSALTAQPSLFANYEGCGWHGFLTSGQMRSV